MFSMQIKIIIGVVMIALLGALGTYTYNGVFEAGANSVRNQLKEQYDEQVLVESTKFKNEFKQYTDATTLAQVKLNEYWSERSKQNALSYVSASVTKSKVTSIKNEITKPSDGCIVDIDDIGLLQRATTIIERPEGFIPVNTENKPSVITTNRRYTLDTVLSRSDASIPEYW